MPTRDNAEPRPWNEGLTGPALAIAQNTHSPLRVLAGPGTGKTFALMRRVSRLLQSGIAPETILVSTFTRTAATDLANALRELGTPGAENVRAETLHALCFRLLSDNEVLARTQRVARPLMDFETRFLLEDLCSDEFGAIRACEDRLTAFSAAWARLQSDEPGWLQTQTDRNFHTQLISWLTFHRAMLIGEVIPVALHYLRENPTCPERTAFGHVLVDEYQDLNRAEQVLLDALATAGTLTVIGDENQSIYSFKYAHPQGIVHFGQYHDGTADETLQQCRRCPRRIVEMANELMRHSPGPPTRELVPFADNPDGEVHVVQWENMNAEAQGIASFIAARIQAGQVTAGNVLVLCPRRQFGYAIRDALNTIPIRAHSFFNEEELEGNPKVLEESLAQQRFVLLTLLAKPDDRVALRCWCGFGHTTLAKTGWRRIVGHCSTSGIAPRDALLQMQAGTLTLPHTRHILERFAVLEAELNRLRQLSGQALIDDLFPPGDSWAEPFRSLVADENSDSTAGTLHELIQTGIVQPELPTHVDYVRIMSLHKSKGLTAELVVVAGCIEGLMPFVKDGLTEPEREQAVEEQRRLYYVALTRARRTLVLSSVRDLAPNVAYRMRASTLRTTDPNVRRTLATRFNAQLGREKPNTITGDDFNAMIAANG